MLVNGAPGLLCPRMLVKRLSKPPVTQDLAQGSTCT